MDDITAYLRAYKRFKLRAKNIGMIIDEKQIELNTMTAISPLTFNIYGKGENVEALNGIESNAMKRLALQQDIERLRQKMQVLQRKIERVNEAMQVLAPMERQIIQYRYIEAYRWMQVASMVGYSERNCQKVSKKALSILQELLQYDVQNEAEQKSTSNQDEILD